MVRLAPTAALAARQLMPNWPRRAAVAPAACPSRSRRCLVVRS